MIAFCIRRQAELPDVTRLVVVEVLSAAHTAEIRRKDDVRGQRASQALRH